MITKGEVSLDVEDNRGPHDWPHLTDLAVEDIQYSVHLPLVPQSGKWPSGREETIAKRHIDPPSGEVVRVLNIVVPESRLLASRERCPFLVHLEVADSGLAGHDARLYASGASPLGSTVEEALSLNTVIQNQRQPTETTSGQVPYEIPPELLDENQIAKQATQSPKAQFVDRRSEVKKVQYSRGGSQSNDQFLDEPAHDGYFYTDPYDYDDVRQQEFEQLHRQMQSPQSPPPPGSHIPGPRW